MSIERYDDVLANGYRPTTRGIDRTMPERRWEGFRAQTTFSWSSTAQARAHKFLPRACERTVHIGRRAQSVVAAMLADEPRSPQAWPCNLAKSACVMCLDGENTSTMLELLEDGLECSPGGVVVGREIP
jgi:hypothetical protein